MVKFLIIFNFLKTIPIPIPISKKQNESDLFDLTKNKLNSFPHSNFSISFILYSNHFFLNHQKKVALFKVIFSFLYSKIRVNQNIILKTFNHIKKSDKKKLL